MGWHFPSYGLRRVDMNQACRLVVAEEACLLSRGDRVIRQVSKRSFENPDALVGMHCANCEALAKSRGLLDGATWLMRDPLSIVIWAAMAGKHLALF
jgi:hypothetical protein